ncbi:MAG: Nif3-like dinuclear metal center hexameric protein [Proteobacteria bacterium]|nr:Nif3-like dinuclear metal center hexameric protein [Pseudomonadota bacterium]
MVKRDELVHYLDERLQIGSIDDVSVNGLQVQGAGEVSKVGLATDAALAVYKQAASMSCDMLVVHHGIVWGGIRRITDRMYEHIKFLIENDMNLYASHLPLDAHPELGNNAILANIIGLQDTQPFGEYHGMTLGFGGALPKPLSLDELAQACQSKIGGAPLALPFGPTQIKTVALSSGGSSSMLPEAIAGGFDCFIAGEGRHEDHHLALEGKINVLYIGHYHSETVGVKALGQDIASHFKIETVFIDEPTIL